MSVYLHTKFQVSSIILTSFRQVGNFTPPHPTSKRTPKKPTHPTSKRTPKKPTQIRVNKLKIIS